MDANLPPEQPATPIVTRPAAPLARPRRRWPAVLAAILGVLLVGSLLFNLLLLAFAASSLEANEHVRERYLFAEDFRTGTDKVVVIHLEGVILTGDGFVKRQIEQATSDEDVKAVVLRIDSPGGTITGSDYIYHHLRKMLEKRGVPLVVSMGSVAASGGYYAAMAVGQSPDTIFAEPTTWTGSIGVIIPHYNLGELMDKVGVAEDSIASHRLKNMGALTRPMTDEEREIFTALVDESFTRFKEIIRSGRPRFAKNSAELDRLATGQVYTADQAKANGLIDRIGFIEDAVNRAIELANLSADNVRVTEYRPETTLASLFMGSENRRRGFDLDSLAELSTPRAWYLFSRLPPLMER